MNKRRRKYLYDKYSYVRIRHTVNDMNKKKRRDKVLFTAPGSKSTNRQVEGQLLGVTPVIERKWWRENCVVFESEER